MKVFETPVIEVTTFTVEDIITESNDGDKGNSVGSNCTPVVAPDW